MEILLYTEFIRKFGVLHQKKFRNTQKYIYLFLKKRNLISKYHYYSFSWFCSIHDFVISSDLHCPNNNCNQADHCQIQQRSNKSQDATHLSMQEFPKSSIQRLSYELQPLQALKKKLSDCNSLIC